MARTRAARAPRRGRGEPVVVDADEAAALEAAELAAAEDDEDAGDEPEPDPMDPFENIREKIRALGARELTLQIKREVTGGGETSLPSLRIPVEKFDEYEDTITAKYGGTDPDGSYRVIFRAGGQYQGTASFRADGPPIKVIYRQPGDEDDRDAGPVSAGAPEGLTAEAVARLISQDAERRETAARLLRLEAAERELAELKRNPPTQGPSAVNELTSAWKNLADQAYKKADTESPEVKVLREQLDVQKVALEDMRSKLHEREKAEAAERFARIERLLRRKRKVKKSSPLGSMTGTLLEITAADAMLAKLTRRVDEGESGGLLDSVLDVFKPEMQRMGATLLKTVRKQMEAAQVAQAAQGNEQVSEAAGEIDPRAWAVWINAIFQNVALVDDVKHVHEGVRRFGPYVNRLISLKTKAELVAFIRETLSDKVAQDFERATDADIVGVLRTLDALRATVVQVAASPPPKAETRADEEEDDDDEDDDTVEGKVSE